MTPRWSIAMRDRADITFALPTGRSLAECAEIIQGAGLPAGTLADPGRALVIDDGGFRYLLGKPTDIPTLVASGAADLGLAGSDVIVESGADIAEILDTGLGRCFFAVAGMPEAAGMFDGHISSLMGVKVATKYVNTATRTFSEWGAQIKILNLNGSVELAPVLGLADCIFDIVQTGGTLKANGLVVIKRSDDVSIRLIANRSALQLRWSTLRSPIEQIRRYISQEVNDAK